MIRENIAGDVPEIDDTAYVDPTAVIIGNVRIGKKVFIAPGAVIRADEPDTSISIGDMCNIQDRVIIHALKSTSVLIDKGSSLSHGCIVHGPAVIGKSCFIGFGSVVFRSVLSDRVFTGHLSIVDGVTVPERRYIPSGSVIDNKKSVPGLKTISEDQEEFILQVKAANIRLTEGGRPFHITS
jgi:carbonic anhydrase/acetyltransferase-like protein (isoleucine patch superfamily)